MIGTGATEEEEHMRSRMGDFHYFSLFLEQLCGGSTYENAQHHA